MKLYEINEIDNILDNIKEHQDLINEAYEVFNNGEAGVDKRLIICLFKTTNDQSETHIKWRLNKIKALYGISGISNVGINELAEKIYKESKEEGQLAIDKRFINFFESYKSEKNNRDEAVYKIFYGKHGTNRASSLATKYAYFLTKQKFPIYDRFVMKALKNLSKEKIQHHIQGKEIYGSDGMPDNFFEVMRAVSIKIGDNKIGTGVDRFDAFCWTWGKIAESKDGEVSVFDKDKSKTFCQKLIDAELLTK